MAKYTHGINGILSGKVGEVVCSSWRGINYVKSKPFLFCVSCNKTVSDTTYGGEVIVLGSTQLKPHL